MRKLKIYLFFYSKALLLFPATIMHESMHLIVAILTFSRITDISILPKIEWNKENPHIPQQIVYGYVAYIPRLKIFHIPIGLAPLLLLPLLYYILHISNIIPDIYNPIAINYKELLTPKGVFISFIAIQTLKGSIPSRQDLMNVKKGIFSVGFFFILIILFALFAVI